MAVATKDEVDALFKVGVGGVKLKGNQYVIKAEEILLKNITDALTRLGANLVSNLEKNAPMDSGGLKKSFGEVIIKETKLGYRIEIPVSADYSDYIDKGVRGVQHTIKNKKVYPNAKGEYYQFETYFMPLKALQNLEGWMKRNNIESDARNLRIRSGDETVKGRRILPQISTGAKRMAYYIKKYGIAGTNFIQKSIDESTPGLEVDLRTIGQNTLILKVSK